MDIQVLYQTEVWDRPASTLNFRTRRARFPELPLGTTVSLSGLQTAFLRIISAPDLSSGITALYQFVANGSLISHEQVYNHVSQNWVFSSESAFPVVSPDPNYLTYVRVSRTGNMIFNGNPQIVRIPSPYPDPAQFGSPVYSGLVALNTLEACVFSQNIANIWGAQFVGGLTIGQRNVLFDAIIQRFFVDWR